MSHLFGQVQDIAVVAAAQALIAGEDDDTGLMDRTSLEQGMLFERGACGGHFLKDLVNPLRIGTSCLSACLCTPQAGGGHHIHRTGDLPDIADAADSISNVSRVLCHKTSGSLWLGSGNHCACGCGSA